MRAVELPGAHAVERADELDAEVAREPLVASPSKPRRYMTSDCG